MSATNRYVKTPYKIRGSSLIGMVIAIGEAFDDRYRSLIASLIGPLYGIVWTESWNDRSRYAHGSSHALNG